MISKIGSVNKYVAKNGSSCVAIKTNSPIHMYSVFHTHYTPSHIVHLINYNLNIYCISLDIMRKYIFNCSLHTLSDKCMYKPKKTNQNNSSIYHISRIALIDDIDIYKKYAKLSKLGMIDYNSIRIFKTTIPIQIGSLILIGK